MRHIGLVVEGPGDRKAVPVLLRKYFAEREQHSVGLGQPWTANGRSKLLKAGELERFVRGAASVPGACAVLVIFDADESPACELGPECAARAKGETALPVQIGLAVREFENWIVASAQSALGHPSPLTDPDGRGAQHAIREALAPEKYIKTVDQPRLAARIDFSDARSSSRSLDRLLHRVDELVNQCREHPAQ